MRKILALVTCVVAVLAMGAAFADTVVLRNGAILQGVVISQTDTEVRIRTDVVTASYKMSDVSSVRIVAQTATASRVANWQTCLAAFVKGGYDGEVQQIPATVIDKGVLKRVPYMSNRSGAYEMNIYGDPDKPACVEIGVYGQLVADAGAQKNCRAFIKSIVGKEADKKLVDLLKSDIDLKEVDGWTFEVTPPTAEDAYGGWWISVYSEKSLDASRASEAELAAITVKKAVAATVKKADTSAAAVAKPAAAEPPTTADLWTADELKRARASADTASPYSGTVYVRGYTRKDGTYVHSYTRSAPKSRR